MGGGDDECGSGFLGVTLVHRARPLLLLFPMPRPQLPASERIGLAR